MTIMWRSILGSDRKGCMLGRGNRGERGRIHRDGKADDRIGFDGSNPNKRSQEVNHVGVAYDESFTSVLLGIPSLNTT